MRLFVGIPLAATVIEELAAISVRHRAENDGMRWSMPESWHITLQFLGNVDQSQYDCVDARLRGLRSDPVAIELDGVDVFDRAGILFVGVAMTPELLALQRSVTSATGVCGFAAEQREYRPHITLARTKGRRRAQGMEALRSKFRRQPRFTRFLAEEFLLYESFTRPTGSVYEIRERFRLGA